jgi:YidC/Oxa1 family membrane protein insertase
MLGFNPWNSLIIDPMVNLLLFIYSVIANFGIAIILFTILIRMITWPLQGKQIKSTAAMQDMQKSKEWQEIQKKYKDDKQKLQQEQMALYKEMGINPLSGCLPLLIQFPLIIGLYQAITRSLAVTPVQMVDLSRHVYPFLAVSKLLPINNQFLWMDLSQPERWYPFGLAIGIPVLAAIVLATTFIQSRLMTPPSQPGEQGAQMSQAMNLYMPLFMGYLALTLASGLSLYFITSNVVTIGQYAAMGKLHWNNLIPGRKPTPVLDKGSPKPALKEPVKETGQAGKKSTQKGGKKKT